VFQPSQRVARIAGMFGALMLAGCAVQSADVEWRYYGSDPLGTKYSTAAQIDAANVAELQVAWRWRNPDDDLAESIRQRPGFFKVTPLMVGGVLYVSTSFSQAAAIDAWWEDRNEREEELALLATMLEDA